MTGIPPSALLEEELVVFEELENAVVRRESRWTTSSELQTVSAELLHALYLLTARAHGAKNVGKPMHIPRPNEAKRSVPALSPRDFALRARSDSG